jgi:hypothetical protein
MRENGEVASRCGNCIFFDGDSCRRRAPLPPDRWQFSLIAMFQAIAIAQLKIANVPDSDVDDMVFKEVTEQYEPSSWPPVEENHWCGEWQADDNRFGVFSSGGMRISRSELAEELAQ